MKRRRWEGARVPLVFASLVVSIAVSSCLVAGHGEPVRGDETIRPRIQQGSRGSRDLLGIVDDKEYQEALKHVDLSKLVSAGYPFKALEGKNLRPMAQEDYSASFSRASAEFPVWANLRAMMTRRARNDSIILSFVGGAIADSVSALNWVQALAVEQDVHNWLLVCFNADACSAHVARNVPAVDASPLLHNCGGDRGCTSFEKLKERVAVRSDILYNAAVWGFRIIVADTNTVWKVPEVENIITSRGDLDMLGMRDLSSSSTAEEAGINTQHRQTGRVRLFNHGFVYFNNTRAVWRLHQRVARLVRTVDCNGNIACLDHGHLRVALDFAGLRWREASAGDDGQPQICSTKTLEGVTLGDTTEEEAISKGGKKDRKSIFETRKMIASLVGGKEVLPVRFALLPNGAFRDATRTTLRRAKQEAKASPGVCGTQPLATIGGACQCANALTQAVGKKVHKAFEHDSISAGTIALGRDAWDEPCNPEIAVVRCSGKFQQRLDCLRRHCAWFLKDAAGNAFLPLAGPRKAKKGEASGPSNLPPMTEEEFDSWLVETWESLEWSLPWDYFDVTSNPQERTPIMTINGYKRKNETKVAPPGAIPFHEWRLQRKSRPGDQGTDPSLSAGRDGE